MIQPEELVESEWAEWYRLTAAQRWLESEKLWRPISRLEVRLSPNPICKVLSSMREHCVRALLMGGQACVFYDPAECNATKLQG